MSNSRQKSEADDTESSEVSAPLADVAATDTAKPKNRPIHKIDIDGVRCSIFAFKSKDGSAEYHRYSISRSYKVNGEWKHSTFFGVEDPVSRLAQEAVEYIRKLHMEPREPMPDQCE